MATLEDVLGIYNAQKIIIPTLEEHAMNEIMRLDILLSGTTPAPWNKNMIKALACDAAQWSAQDAPSLGSMNKASMNFFGVY